MKATLSGLKIVNLCQEEDEKQKRDFKSYRSGMVRLQPDNWIFPKEFLKYVDDIYKFQFKKSDVLIMTWPKCGTTWTQEIVWTMRSNPNFDNSDANQFISMRSPFIELDFIVDTGLQSSDRDTSVKNVVLSRCSDADFKRGLFLLLAETTPEPRTLKTHLPFCFFPKNLLENTKVICVTRNPKDACASFYHHCRLLKCHDYVGTREDFVEHFCRGNLLYGPYDKFLELVWQRRKHKNLLILSFEEMKMNLEEAVRKIDSFVNTSLTTEQIKKIAEYCTFDQMKERQAYSGDQKEPEYFNEEVLHSDGGFFRKGEIGGFKGILTGEEEEKIEKWKEEKIKEKGMNFPFL